MTKILQVLGEWKIDLKVIFLTVVISPLILYIAKATARFVRHWLTYFFEALLFKLAHLIRGNLVGRLTLARYCRLKLGEENKYLYVPSSMDIKLDVDEVYVPLSMGHSSVAGRRLDHANLASSGSRIRVIGDPGSGKSSLIKKIMRDSCRRAMRKPKDSALPILIELKSLQVPQKKNGTELGIWLYQKIKQDVSKRNVYGMDECFEAYAQGSGVLVLLDGLDEVSGDSFERVFLAIDGLSKKLAERSHKNVIILTMRTQFHYQVKHHFRETFGQVVLLNPFTPTNIFEFLSRWPFVENAREHINRIYKELTDLPTLREMCANPLVLSMYVAEDQAKGRLIAPESRTEFYKKVADELLIKRRLSQKGPLTASSKLREQRERILGHLALEHMLDENESINSLDWKRAILEISKIMRCDEGHAIDLFRDIAKETGLISEERPEETYRFIHLTFCEFLAALEVANGGLESWQRLYSSHIKFQGLGRQHASRLAEVIPFACGVMPRTAKVQALDEIYKLNDVTSLAKVFLETKQYENDLWDKFISTWQERIAQAGDVDIDENWLRELQLFNVVIVDAERCSKYLRTDIYVPDINEFYSKIFADRSETLSKVLWSYAARDAAAVFRLVEVNRLHLARDFPEIIIENADQKAFFSMVVEQAIKEEECADTWIPLLAEAALRSSLVATSMRGLPKVPAWERLIKKSSGQKWLEVNISGQSMLSQILGIVRNEDLEFQYSCRLVKIFRSIPLRPALAPNNILVIIIAIILIIIAIKKSNTSVWEAMIAPWPSSPGLVISAMVITCVAYYLTFRFQAARSIYKEIIFGSSNRVLEMLIKNTSLEMFMLRSFTSYGTMRRLIKKDVRQGLEYIKEARSLAESEAKFKQSLGK